MINQLSTYYNAGYAAGDAQSKKDQGSVSFHTNWFNKAKRLETNEDRIIAEQEFTRGYKEAQPVR